MNRREWMQSGLGAAGVLLTAGRVRGDEPPDDSDPAPLIAKMASVDGDDTPSERSSSRRAFT